MGCNRIVEKGITMNKVSFIIPVYNCATYLRQCVKNICKIGLEKYEIILVNDGSTDDSEQVCKELLNVFNTVKYVYQSNQGASAARNRGLSIADGDYVIFLDADDIIEPQKFFVLLQKLEKKSNVDIAIFGHSFDYYYNKILYRRDEMQVPLTGVKSSSFWIQNLKELYSTNALNPIWNKVFKRSFLITNKLYLRNDMFLYEDLEYSLRCMTHCQNILFDPDVIYHYRQNTSAVQRLKRLDYISELIVKIEESFNNLLAEKQAQEEKEVIENIILTLYLTLAREKIAVSNFKEIEGVCDDFAAWYCSENHQDIRNKLEFIEDLLRHKVFKLVIRRSYTALRHKIAVRVKSSALYKKRIN